MSFLEKVKYYGTLQFLGPGSKEGVGVIMVLLVASVFGMMLAPFLKPLLGILAGIFLGYLIFDRVRYDKRGRKK